MQKELAADLHYRGPIDGAPEVRDSIGNCERDRHPPVTRCSARLALGRKRAAGAHKARRPCPKHALE